MEKKEHPHAHVLRWIADGEEIEVCRISSDEDWMATSYSSVLVRIAAFPDEWQFRIKPIPMCELAGIKFPVPMKEAPTHGTKIWVASVDEIFCITWCGEDDDKEYLSAGLCHTTEEAAKAHSEALRKVNLMAIEGAK